MSVVSCQLSVVSCQLLLATNNRQTCLNITHRKIYRNRKFGQRWG
ncbi:MAG: hypothetical protein ACKPHM_21180 [Dolichospermum sp.]